jgi:hypothetical protein
MFEVRNQSASTGPHHRRTLTFWAKLKISRTANAGLFDQSHVCEWWLRELPLKVTVLAALALRPPENGAFMYYGAFKPIHKKNRRRIK